MKINDIMLKPEERQIYEYYVFTHWEWDIEKLLKAQLLKLQQIADREGKPVVIVPKEWTSFKGTENPYPDNVLSTGYDKWMAYHQAQAALIKDIREKQMIRIEE